MDSDNGHTKPPFLRALAIESFRGFNARVDLDLASSAIVVWGANGRGKTSFTDAIQWLLLGKLPRLEPFRFRRNEEHVVNRYAAMLGKRAIVEAVLQPPGQARIRARRVGDYRGSTLEVEQDGVAHLGPEAERRLRFAVCGTDVEASEFERYTVSMALLQQDVVRAFLNDKPADSYELLSRLLGLEVLNEFVHQLEASVSALEERARAARSGVDASRQEQAQVESRRAEVEARLSVLNSYRALGAELEMLASGGGPLASWANRWRVQTVASARQLISALQSIDSDLVSLLNWTEHYDDVFSQQPPVSQPDLEAQISDAETALAARQQEHVDRTGELRQAESRHTAETERAESIERLAAAAIPLLASVCPVCGQSIDADTVAGRLRQRLGDTGALEQARQGREIAAAGLMEAQQALGLAQQRLNELEAQRRAAVRWEESVEQAVSTRDAAVERLEAASVALPDLSVGEAGGRRPLSDPGAGIALQQLVTHVRAAIASFEALGAAESTDVYQSELAQLNNRNEALNRELGERTGASDELTRQVEDRKRLVANARDSATQVVDETFRELEPVVKDLFARLSPHPAFRRLSLTHQVYLNRGTSVPTAHDDDYQVDISPATGFSSAQANVAALCYFLAFAFSGSQIRFPFVVLDDPLQSMDDINVLGFSDLCRFLRSEKQLIVSTHDDRLASLLLRKLTPRTDDFDATSIEFVSWGREGPNLRITKLERERPAAVFAS